MPRTRTAGATGKTQSGTKRASFGRLSTRPRQCGESYRTIAEVLLGFRGTKTDWEGDPRKNKARRLVASGQRLMRGGYRTLLHYPIKLPRR